MNLTRKTRAEARAAAGDQAAREEAGRKDTLDGKIRHKAYARRGTASDAITH